MSTEPRVPDAPPADRQPVTLPRLAEMKRNREPIVMVTAYDYPSAQVAEAGRRGPRAGRGLGRQRRARLPEHRVGLLDEMLMLARAVRRGATMPCWSPTSRSAPTRSATSRPSTRPCGSSRRPGSTPSRSRRGDADASISRARGPSSAPASR